MSLFKSVTLSWGDVKYVIPADRVLQAIAVTEEHLTLHELQVYHARGTAPMARIAQAYAALLRYAGCNVTDEVVYQTIVTKKNDAGAVITALLLMMLPPVLQEASASGNVSKGEAKLSRRRSKSPVVNLTLPRQNSGA